MLSYKFEYKCLRSKEITVADFPILPLIEHYEYCFFYIIYIVKHVSVLIDVNAIFVHMHTHLPHTWLTTLLTCIWQVLSSDLSWDTDDPDRGRWDHTCCTEILFYLTACITVLLRPLRVMADSTAFAVITVSCESVSTHFSSMYCN
jgi:hypothetical protein